MVDETMGEWCDFHPGRAWRIQAWNIGMDGREWLCGACYEQRTNGPGQQFRYCVERDRDHEDAQIRGEAMAFQREHPEEHQRLIEQGMEVVNQLLAEKQPVEPRAICRACNNTGIEIFTRLPCTCPTGRAKAQSMTPFEVVDALYVQINVLQDENDRLRDAQANEPRAIIRRFALAMERKLAANEHKPGWKDEDASDLLKRLYEEYQELYEAVASCVFGDGSAEEVLQEAADVGNFAAMICDVVGALPPTDERGR